VTRSIARVRVGSGPIEAAVLRLRRLVSVPAGSGRQRDPNTHSIFVEHPTIRALSLDLRTGVQWESRRVVGVTGGKQRRWPAEVRAAALELAANVGPQRAAREMDLSENTLKSWQQRAARRAHRELARADLVMPVRVRMSWVERRDRLLPALGELAEESIAAARLAVSEGRAKAASDFASVAARMVDRAAVLGGDVSSRSESRSLSVHVDAEKKRALQEEIDELERELEVERKELGDGRS
jgi:transposase-like protein